MAEYDHSVVDLIKTAVRDAQDLVRSEIALAKAEVREEVRRIGLAAALLAGAAVVGVVAFAFVMTTLAWGLAAAFAWPAWAGFGVVTLLMLLTTAVLAYVGRRKLVTERHLPKTTDTMKENTQWIRARTS